MIDFDYYLSEYNGQKIQSEETFNGIAKVAEKYVLRATDNRGTVKEIGEAICAVSEILFEVGESEGIKSESVDGLSVAYEDSRTQKLIHNALKLYLPSRLLYRGI